MHVKFLVECRPCCRNFVQRPSTGWAAATPGDL